jgi:putative ABC transport system permease protein
MTGLIEYVKIAIMNLKSNKGRSVLTMLGIIIGISSVIMIISIGNGVTEQVNGELNDMAGGQLYIYVNNDKADELLEFTNEDFEAIEEKVAHVKGVTPSYSIYGTASGKKGSFDALVNAGTESQEYIKNNPIKYGRYYTESDYYSGNKVCVISENDAILLFGTTDVVGMNIEFSMYGISQEMTIVGIRETPNSAMFISSTSSVTIEIPITTLGAEYGFYVEAFDGFYIIGESPEYATDIAKQSIRILEGRYNIRGEDRILLEDFNTYMKQINDVLGYITVFVVFVAAISLLVGGIGVMNIMLVSVTERTREIGIRKALGARTSSIMTQFLSESAIISLTGGVIGIILGVLGAFLVCALIGLTPRIDFGTVFGATFFSSAVGIFFGIYPAKKAAKLSPIEALRHE